MKLDAYDGLEVGRLAIPVRTLRYKEDEIEDIVLAGQKFHDEDVQWLGEGKGTVLYGVMEVENPRDPYAWD